MSKKKLYIHIGSHKTGTTSIQHALVLNEGGLAARGATFYYKDSLSGKNLLPDLHSWLTFAVPGRVVPSGLRIKEPTRLASELSGVGTDVIVSSENFGFVFDQREILQLQAALSKYFDSIKIICYIRRQDRHVISHHQEGSKLNRAAEYDIFGHSTRAIPPYGEKHDLYLDYFKKLSMWGDAFGDENMIIKVYDRNQLKNGDVVDDFFGLFDIENFARVGQKNSGLGFVRAKLGHLINRSPIVNKLAIARFCDAIDSDGFKMLPSRASAVEYYERFRAGNRRLNSRFHISDRADIFDDDFDDYPVEDGDLWTEDLANQTLVGLLSAVDETYGDLGADEFRDAALAIEGRNLQLSYKLMRAAQRLRPRGELIARKIAEYDEKLAAVSSGQTRSQ